MKLLIGIATYKRIEKLKRLLKSLKNQTYDNFIIHVVCDNNDIETENYIKSLEDYKLGHIACTVNNKHKYVIGAWNQTVQNYINTYVDFDGFIGLCDDVELPPNTLEMMVKWYRAFFKDYDGVAGFNQECPGHKNYTFAWYGQTLIGRKFIERYKKVNYQICCPFYKHFYQDEELYFYASSMDKFYCCKQATLFHYHPCFISEEIDETHKIIRSGKNSPKQYDIALYNKRRKEGKIWGRTWEE